MAEKGSGRDFFSFRYFVPGFVFVILVFSINLDGIVKLLSTNTETNLAKLDATAILTLITFLSSPAVGFLAVQSYYVMIECPRLVRKNNECSKELDEIKEKLRKQDICENIVDDNLKITPRYLWVHTWVNHLIKLAVEEPKDKEKKLEELKLILQKWKAFADFSFRTLQISKEYDPLYDYLTRRWDLFNTLRSTLLTLGLGLFVGIMVRIFFGCPKGIFFIISATVIVVSIILGITLFFGSRIVMHENRDMLILISRFVPKENYYLHKPSEKKCRKKESEEEEH